MTVLAVPFHATWKFGTSPPGQPASSPKATASAGVSDGPPHPPRWPQPDPPTDPETIEAMSRRHELPVITDPKGVRLFRNNIALFGGEHDGPVLAQHVAVTRDGDLFHARGWLKVEDAATVRRFRHCSPTFHVRLAYLAHAVRPIGSLIFAREVWLEHVTPTNQPVDKESTFALGQPSPVPASELRQLVSF